MENPVSNSAESDFMKKNIPLLLSRYALSYHMEGDCVEYFITDKTTHEDISRALVLSLNRCSKQINVAKFYPDCLSRLNPNTSLPRVFIS